MQKGKEMREERRGVNYQDGDEERKEIWSKEMVGEEDGMF